MSEISSGERMVWAQCTIQLPPLQRGCHLVTDKVLEQCASPLSQIKVGLAHIFIQHTSASLTINEVGQGRHAL